jgi:spore maturation protein CgeB
MRILIVGTQKVPWMASGWSRALRDLGQDVISWDWTPLFSPGPLGRIEQRYLLGPGIARANRALLRQVSQCQPDVVLLYATTPIWPKTVQFLAHHTWVSGYHNDNPFGLFGKKAYFRFWKGSLPYFHSHHVFRPVNVEDYQRAGVKRVKLLLPFYIPWLHVRPELLPEERQELGADVVFVGHSENDGRIQYVQALLEAGINLRVRGDAGEWKRYLPISAWKQLQPVRPAEGVEYRKVIAASKIALSFFSTGNRDSVTFRVFELPAMGSFMLCQRSELAMEIFCPEHEAVFFSSTEELIDKCQFYLQNDQLREQIAMRGQERCLAGGYDLHSRMRQWVADIRTWMSETN